MDKEFGTSQLTADQVGWDWFSLQLDDGRDLMLYVLRDRDGGIDHASGTLVEPDGSARSLRDDDFRLEAVATWRSPASGTTYPSGWRLELPGEGLRLRVEPELADQENVVRLARELAYWEGAVRAVGEDGARLGRGYVELTGYAGDGGLGFLRDREP
jgi:predicted secreted hydrolase